VDKYVVVRFILAGCSSTLYRYISAYTRGAGADITSKIVERVEEVAKKRDISMAQVALAWILSKNGISFNFWIPSV